MDESLLLNRRRRRFSFQESSLTSAVGRALDVCKNCAIDKLSLSGVYWHWAELSQQVVAQFVDRLPLIPVQSVLISYVDAGEDDLIAVLKVCF